jgi:hypothetical protein
VRITGPGYQRLVAWSARRVMPPVEAAPAPAQSAGVDGRTRSSA